MKHERRDPFSLFVVCLLAAMPYAWGQVGFEDVTLEPSASLEGVKIDVLKVGVTLCHIPPGDPGNAQTIVVSQAGVAAHLAHGDYLGECHSACATVPSPVPKTGQTECWDLNGNPIACAGTGQDGEYRTGVSVSPRFTDNLNGTVKDNLTGLIWLKDAGCVGFQPWTEAFYFSKNLASGVCGLTDGSVVGDWRLPNVRELQSLIDFDRFGLALPDGHPFVGVFPADYWSSTSTAVFSGNAWVVNLTAGAVNFFDKPTGFNLVWPVRGGQ